jgi:hypothetical protein
MSPGRGERGVVGRGWMCVCVWIWSCMGRLLGDLIPRRSFSHPPHRATGAPPHVLRYATAPLTLRTCRTSGAYARSRPTIA